MEETASALAMRYKAVRRCMSGSPLTRQSGAKNGRVAARVENSAFNSSTSYNLLNRWVDKSGLLDTLQNTAWAVLPLLLWLRDC